MITYWLQYDFIVRGLEAGLLIGLIAPLIGIFLVLRRYALMADTLAHVSLLGVAFGLVVGVSPLLTSIGTSTVAAVLIERLRHSRRVYGESALALFLSGSLALAIIVMSWGHGLNADVLSYLFGSIVTVGSQDVVVIIGLGIIVLLTVLGFYKELVFVSFDEDSAQVAGLPTRAINLLLIVLSAVTIAIAIPIVGILLISALIVIPVLSALQLGNSFRHTIFWAEFFSIASVVLGFFASLSLNIAASGAIIVVALGFFLMTLLSKQH